MSADKALTLLGSHVFAEGKVDLSEMKYTINMTASGKPSSTVKEIVSEQFVNKKEVYLTRALNSSEIASSLAIFSKGNLFFCICFLTSTT